MHRALGNHASHFEDGSENPADEMQGPARVSLVGRGRAGRKEEREGEEDMRGETGEKIFL